MKGWAAGRAGRVLTEHGLPDHCVNAAGDVVLGGRPGPDRYWRVGIADPRTPGALLGAVDAGGADAASGRWPPPASPNGGCTSAIRGTGGRADGVLSATVVGADPAVADGLATALVVAGPAAPDCSTGGAGSAGGAACSAPRGPCTTPTGS